MNTYVLRLTVSIFYPVYSCVQLLVHVLVWTVIRLLVYTRLDCYPKGFFDYVLNMCYFCFAFRSHHSLCERCLSVVPVVISCCFVFGCNFTVVLFIPAVFTILVVLRIHHPSRAPKLGCCRSVPLTYSRWWSKHLMPCLKRCRVPFMSTDRC